MIMSQPVSKCLCPTVVVVSPVAKAYIQYSTVAWHTYGQEHTRSWQWTMVWQILPAAIVLGSHRPALLLLCLSLP
jgi:hypothetical protein